MKATSFSRDYLARLQEVLADFPHAEFERLITVFLEAWRDDRRILVMGNGGSAATASHWVCDLNKGCGAESGKRFKMLCLNDNLASLMAYANDCSYEDVFVEPLKNYFVPGDVVVGISGSGNSPNVLKAVDYGRRHGGVTVGLSGFDGGRLAGMVDVPLVARINDMQKVEDVHLIIVHMSMQRLLRELSCGRPAAAC